MNKTTTEIIAESVQIADLARQLNVLNGQLGYWRNAVGFHHSAVEVKVMNKKKIETRIILLQYLPFDVVKEATIKQIKKHIRVLNKKIKIMQL